MIRLTYLQANQAWVFLFGDTETYPGSRPSIITIHGAKSRFFTSRQEAVAAARSAGLKVDKKGVVSSINPSNMNGLEDTDEEILIQRVAPGKTPPKNNLKWPRFPEKPGYVVAFKQFGSAGKGYYYVRPRPSTDPRSQHYDPTLKGFETDALPRWVR